MIRVLKGQPSELSLGRDTKPTSATVTITRDRDSASIASAAACVVEADRVVYSLAAQSSVSNLTAVFTVVDAAGTSTVTVPVQVVGTRACSIADCRRQKPLDNVNRYDDVLLLQTIAEIEDQLEAACGVSFIVREQTFTVDGSGTSELFVRARPRSVRSATVGGASVSPGDITIDEEAGVLIIDGTWNAGRRNVRVTGEFGHADVPGIVRQAVAEGVRYALMDSRVDPRAISTTSEDGTTSQLVTAGVRGAMFSLPALNQCVSMFRQSFGVA